MMFIQNQKHWTGGDEKPSIVCYSSLILVLFFTFKNVGQLPTFRWVIGPWIFFENEENQ